MENLGDLLMESLEESLVELLIEFLEELLITNWRNPVTRDGIFRRNPNRFL